MNLERQLDDFEPVPDENSGSVLPDIAEWADEVILVAAALKITPASVMGSGFCGYSFCRGASKGLPPT
jgi:hypothetical protein